MAPFVLRGDGHRRGRILDGDPLDALGLRAHRQGNRPGAGAQLHRQQGGVRGGRGAQGRDGRQDPFHQNFGVRAGNERGLGDPQGEIPEAGFFQQISHRFAPPPQAHQLPKAGKFPSLQGSLKLKIKIDSLAFQHVGQQQFSIEAGGRDSFTLEKIFRPFENGFWRPDGWGFGHRLSRFSIASLIFSTTVETLKGLIT